MSEEGNYSKSWSTRL